LHVAAQAVMSGSMDVVIAAGVECMTRCPMGLPMLKSKDGFGEYMSPLMKQRYQNEPFSQFSGAEMMARQFGLSKDVLDEFAFQSHERAIIATKEMRFRDEIAPVQVRLMDGTCKEELHLDDEGIRFDVTLDGIRGVKRIFEGGALTAATSSQICDGASGVMVVNERGLKMLGAKPLARIHHMSVLGGDPVVMLDTPLAATKRALNRAGLKIEDIDLYEVNEAFAPVPLAWLKAINADPERLNVNGGAIALGHPLGASGTKLMTTLIYALKQRNKRYGLQTMCEGGGMANVTIIERL
jgi:acetyl-CoA C-acetyltransferase